MLLLDSDIKIKETLKSLGVDKAGIEIMASKAKLNFILLKNLKVAAANILKQDALSIGADLAVPRGCVSGSLSYVDALLIASDKHLKLLSKKELAQPFGLKRVAKELEEILKIKMPKKVEIMGVLNANNDSFYPSSRFGFKEAQANIEKMIEDGADIIDIGAISSAPKSIYVGSDEEVKRLKPILQLISEQKLYQKVKFSIDSFDVSSINLALDSGFSIVNDITGLRDTNVAKLASAYSASVVIMHMLQDPLTMQDNPQYKDVIGEIYDFFEQRVELASSYGIKDIILDVGIGFGKTLKHNLMLIKHHKNFLRLGKPMLIGASRKSMIDKITPSSVEQRLSGTLTLHLEAIKNGASMIRVHDVKEHYQALKVYEALRGVDL